MSGYVASEEGGFEIAIGAGVVEYGYTEGTEFAATTQYSIYVNQVGGAQKVTLPEGTVFSLYADASENLAGKYLKVALYDSSGNLVCETPQAEPPNGTYGWTGATFPNLIGTTTITAGDYQIAMLSGSSNIFLHRSTGHTSGDGGSAANGSFTIPDPLPALTANDRWYNLKVGVQ